ncbi:MAG: hypothetical protein H0X33_08250 [Taibaiella sp.]|nr:hypothetical protein [Taibaiella sp.]
MKIPFLISFAVILIAVFILCVTVPDDAALKANAEDYVTDHLQNVPTHGLPMGMESSIEIADFGLYKEVKMINKNTTRTIGYGYLNGFHNTRPEAD